MFITEYGWDGIAFFLERKTEAFVCKVFLSVYDSGHNFQGAIWKDLTLSLVHAFHHELCLFREINRKSSFCSV